MIVARASGLLLSSAQAGRKPAPQKLIVEITDLRHAYGDRVALDGVSLSVDAGEIFALLGPNGSGKTTLFRILSTLVPAPAGKVRIAGHGSRS